MHRTSPPRAVKRQTSTSLRTFRAVRLLPLLVLLALPAAVQAQFLHTNNNDTIPATGPAMFQ